jgi:hypothetical protein
MVDIKNISTQKQKEVLAQWASGEGVPFTDDSAKEAYQYRANLLVDAIQLEKTPDRVPILPLTIFAPGPLYGRSGKEMMYDANVLGQTYLDFTRDYNADFGGPVPMVMYGPGIETLDYKLYKWPGHGVKEELSYQFHEKEYMKAEEYDHFIADPSDYWFRIWMSRTAGALAPLADLPPLYGTCELPMASPYLCALGAPHIQEAYKKLLKAGEQYFNWINELMPYLGQIMGSGYPFSAGGFTKAPFDVLGDSFRGTTALMMDLYRRPEKVLEAIDRLVPLMIDLGVGTSTANNNPLVFIPLHKGADGFMSNEQFGKYYWPTLKAVMGGLIEAGCVPVLFVEGGYDQRLEFLKEVPKGSTFYLFDRTNMIEARKHLEGIACIGGGFPITKILTGSVADVEKANKKLLDDVKGDGGYVLSIGCAMDEAKEDTLKAFINTGLEYGKY